MFTKIANDLVLDVDLIESIEAYRIEEYRNPGKVRSVITLVGNSRLYSRLTPAEIWDAINKVSKKEEEADKDIQIGKSPHHKSKNRFTGTDSNCRCCAIPAEPPKK